MFIDKYEQKMCLAKSSFFQSLSEVVTSVDKQKKLFFNNIIAAFCVPIEYYQRGHHIISIEEGAKAFEKCKKEFY